MKTSSTIVFCDSNYLALLYDPWFKSGGATRQVAAWVEGLKAVGINVIVLGAHRKPAFFADRENTLICYHPDKGIPKLRYLYIRIPGIVRAFLKARPDYIYHGIPSPFAGVIGICSLLSRRKFILRVSNDFFVDDRVRHHFDPIRKFFFNVSFRLADYILCQNDYQYQKVKEIYPNKTYKIGNPYFGVIPEKATPSDGRDGVAWIGIFQRQKNLPLLAEIARNLPDVKFKVAGGNDKSLESKDQAALEELREMPNVRLLGFLNREEVLRLLDESRLLLNTSHYEGFSNTFLEAFSRGTPVFTQPQNDPDGIIQAHRLGAVYTGDELPGKLYEYLEDEKAFEGLSSNCLRYMKKYHDLKTQARSFLEIIER